MPERDWAKDWELCQKAKEKAAEIIQDPTLLIEIPREYRLEVLLHHLGFLEEALEGWPAALEKIRELEQRVRELEEALDYCEIALTHVGEEKEKYERLALEKIRQLREV